jgi:hypothetical protein
MYGLQVQTQARVEVRHTYSTARLPGRNWVARWVVRTCEPRGGESDWDAVASCPIMGHPALYSSTELRARQISKSSLGMPLRPSQPSPSALNLARSVCLPDPDELVTPVGDSSLLSTPAVQLAGRLEYQLPLAPSSYTGIAIRFRP